eukprot:1211833-Rhodomonas_salina.1
MRHKDGVDGREGLQLESRAVAAQLTRVWQAYATHDSRCLCDHPSDRGPRVHRDALNLNSLVRYRRRTNTLKPVEMEST